MNNLDSPSRHADFLLWILCILINDSVHYGLKYKIIKTFITDSLYGPTLSSFSVDN